MIISNESALERLASSMNLINQLSARKTSSKDSMMSIFGIGKVDNHSARSTPGKTEWRSVETKSVELDSPKQVQALPDSPIILQVLPEKTSSLEKIEIPQHPLLNDILENPESPAKLASSNIKLNDILENPESQIKLAAGLVAIINALSTGWRTRNLRSEDIKKLERLSKIEEMHESTSGSVAGVQNQINEDAKRIEELEKMIASSGTDTSVSIPK